MHFDLLPLMRALFLETNPVPVKAALSMMGFCRDELRLPLLPMSESLRPRLRQALADAGCRLAKD
jgi:4-hydroxy-tetrahydrodipicolinate synthase